jgi:tetratricopeptide (TPR) repeat protein
MLHKLSFRASLIWLFLAAVRSGVSANEVQQSEQQLEFRAEWRRQVDILQAQIAKVRKAIADNARSERMKFLQPGLYMILGDNLIDLCYADSIAHLTSERAAAAEEARLAFQGAMLSGGHPAAALYGSGRAASCSEDYLSAVEFYKRALKSDPAITGLHRNLGIAYIQLGRFRNGREVLEVAVRNDPDDGPARFHLATAYLQLGQPMLAREQCEALKELGQGVLCSTLKFPSNGQF